MSGENLRARRRQIRIAAAVCMLAALAVGGRAEAQTRLKAHYTLSMTGVPIGQIAWLVAIGEQRYTTSANGKASGVLSVLVNGEGSVDVRGMIVDGHATPRFFTSSIVDDDGPSELRMTLEEGTVRDLSIVPPPSDKDRLPVRDADRIGVIDPLSAMLIPSNGDVLATGNCNQVLPVFDGRRRYDLVLSYKRHDRISLERSYSGVVAVCGVVLKPIAGHRPDSMIVKYVADRRDMELWFAPISSTAMMAPVRIVVPTLLGTLEIAADQFDVQPSAPPSATSR